MGGPGPPPPLAPPSSYANVTDSIVYLKDLSIAVSSELSEDKVDIVEDDEEISAVNVSCFVDETEWTICDLVYSEPRTVNKEFTENQFKNPALNVKCVAVRKAGFFMYNIILIMVRIYNFFYTFQWIIGISR